MKTDPYLLTHMRVMVRVRGSIPETRYRFIPLQCRLRLNQEAARNCRIVREMARWQ